MNYDQKNSSAGTITSDYGFDEEQEFDYLTPVETTPSLNEKRKEQLQLLMTITSGFLDLAEKVLKITASIRTIIKESENFIIPDSIYTEEEIARFLKVGRNDLRNMIVNGRLRALKINENEYRIMGKSVLAFFDYDKDEQMENISDVIRED